MFGYVKTDFPNTYVKDVILYKAMYCGLCKSIGKCCGQKGRLLLSYDLTFLSVLLHNVLGEDVKVVKQHCVIHPITKKHVATPTPLSEEIGALNVILAYYKLCDDVLDDNKGRLKRTIFKSSYKRAKKKYPKLDQIVEKHFNKLLDLEKQNCDSVDVCADPFGLMIEEIVRYFVPDCPNALAELSYDLGKWIYLIDALDDFDKDLKKHSFNVFVNAYKDVYNKQSLIKEKAFDISSLFGGIIVRLNDNCTKINYKFNHDLIENVLILGIKQQTKNVMECKKCKNITKF